MSNALPVAATPQYNFDFSILKNPWIVCTAICVAGVCYCYTIGINAKYNRYTELSCGTIHLTCASSDSSRHLTPTQN